MNFDDLEQETKKVSDVNNHFANYIFNNWKKEDVKNEILENIYNLGGAIWLNCEGDLCYRFSEDSEIYTQTATKASTVFTNYLNRSVRFINGTKEHIVDITARDLIMVHSEVFNPFENKEFFLNNGLYYRNKFKPTKYLQLDKVDNYIEPKTIISLINHISGGNGAYFTNWLAYFFRKLKKSQVSIVLRGEQGAGKGIFFNEVLRPLFGANYCIQINDKTLDTKFLGGIVDGRLFYNLDEVSHNIASSKNIKNFLKALVTNESITAEKKNKDLSKETKLFGQVLITSNEPYVIEVESNDRRYSIFTTGKSLKKVNYLGLGNYDNFRNAIKKELKSFCIYLRNYPINEELANTALETREKQALINATQDSFKLFATAIKNKDLNYFEDLKENNILLYDTLINDLKNNRILRPKIFSYFIAINDIEIKKTALMKRLKVIEPLLFSNDNITTIQGDRYFKL